MAGSYWVDHWWPLHGARWIPVRWCLSVLEQLEPRLGGRRFRPHLAASHHVRGRGARGGSRWTDAHRRHSRIATIGALLTLLTVGCRRVVVIPPSPPVIEVGDADDDCARACARIASVHCA